MYNLVFVDDESRVLEAIRGMLPWEEMNVRVIGWCSNAISALELMVDEHADILVTDINMPVINGLELITRAKEMYPAIECLVLSGYEEFELARSAIECGVRGYLLKPCSKEELESSIRKCVKVVEQKQGDTMCHFEQHQRQIANLYDDLVGLRMENEEVVMLVREVFSRYHDFGVLKEAAILVAVQHEQLIDNPYLLVKKLAQAQTVEDLIEGITQILRKINKQSIIIDPVVAKVVDYVYHHYNITSLTLQYVADSEIHLTSRYVGRRFLKEMNMKFSDFLLKVRMEKAIEFLHEKEYSNAEQIASEIGLGNNVQYFYRLFRQYTGMTLKEYRDRIVKKDMKKARI